MRRTLNIILLALAVTLGPVSTASAQLAPPTLQFVAGPVMLAEAVLAPTPDATPAALASEELPTPPSWNPADWFKEAGALALFVAFAVALLKRNVFKALEGVGTLAVSFGLAIGISLLGTLELPVFGRVNPVGPLEAVSFGISAAVLASGGWDVIKSLLLAMFGGKSPGAKAAST